MAPAFPVIKPFAFKPLTLGFNSTFPGDAQAKRLHSLEQSVEAAGGDLDRAQPKSNLFLEILNVLDKPKQIIQGPIDAAIRGDLGRPGVGFGIQRALDERLNGFDMLRRAGVKNPVVRGLGGFALDVFTDPLFAITPFKRGATIVGGAALSAKGAKRYLNLQDDFVHNISKAGDQTLAKKNSDLIEDVFRRANKRSEIENRIRQAENLGDTTGAEAARKRLIDFELDLDQFLDAGEVSGVSDSLLKAGAKFGKEEDLTGLFQRGGISWQYSLPFLGHFTGKESAKAAAGAGGIRQALTTAGNILKPDTVKLRQFEFTPEFVNAVDNISGDVKRILEGVKQSAKLGVEATKDIPVLGTATKVAVGGAEVAARTGKVFSDFVQRTFTERAFLGPDFHDRKLDLINFKTAIPSIAMGRIADKIPEFKQALDKADPSLLEPIKGHLKNASITIDKHMSDSLLKNLKLLSPEEMDDLFKLTKNGVRGVDIDPLDMMALGSGAKMKELDQVVRGELEGTIQRFLRDSDEGTQTVGRYMKSLVDEFDELVALEKAAGIDLGFVAAYVPHRFKRMREAEINAGSLGSAFTRRRSFGSLEDAIKSQGMVPDTDFFKILSDRISSSESLRASRRFTHKVMLENSIGADSMQALAYEALVDPNGVAARMLKGDRFNVAKLYDPDSVQSMLDVMGNQYARKAAEGVMKTRPVELVDAQRMTKEMFPNPEMLKLTSAERKAIIGGGQEAIDTIDLKLKAVGVKSLKDSIPDALMGQIGTFNKTINKWVPNEISRAVEDTVKARDYIKDFFVRNNSEAGQAFLDVADWSLNQWKSWVTLPFPGYWSQNMMGDTFFRMADQGWGALDPTSFVETYEVLKGARPLITKDGRSYNQNFIKEMMKQEGWSYSPRELIDFMGSTAKSDPQRFIQAKRGVRANLKEGNPVIALEELQKHTQQTFEGFFRTQQMFTNLKRGMSPRDAMREANHTMLNYRDMSPTEKSLFKRFYMFYSWVGKSTKKTLTSLMTSPGDIKQQILTARSLSEFASDPNAAPSPDEMDLKLVQSAIAQDTISFPLGKDNDGNTLIARRFGLPASTMLESFSFQTPRAFTIGDILGAAGINHRTAQLQFSQANPGIRVPMEALTGKSFYFDRPIDSDFLNRLPEFASMAENIAPYNFAKIPAELLDDASRKFLKAVPDGNGNMVADPGKFYVFVNLIPGLSRLMSTGTFFSDNRTGLMPSLIRSLTGVRIDVQDSERSHAYKYERELRAELARAEREAQARSGLRP